MGFISQLITGGPHLVGFNGDLVGFNGDLMGFYSDLMGFYRIQWDLDRAKLVNMYNSDYCMCCMVDTYTC